MANSYCIKEEPLESFDIYSQNFQNFQFFPETNSQTGTSPLFERSRNNNDGFEYGHGQGPYLPSLPSGIFQNSWQNVSNNYSRPMPTYSVHPNQVNVSLPSISPDCFTPNTTAGVSYSWPIRFDPVDGRNSCAVSNSGSQNFQLPSDSFYSSNWPLRYEDENQISSTCPDLCNIPVSGQSDYSLNSIPNESRNSCLRIIGSANKKKPSKVIRRGSLVSVQDKKCVNCGTVKTTLWRRGQFNQIVCNPCGLYWKLHKEKRPRGLWKPTFQQRKSKPRRK